MSVKDHIENSGKSIPQERMKEYDHPLDNFRRIDLIKQAVKDCEDAEIRHALEMIGVKMARLVTTPDHQDSIDDIQGYAETINMIWQKRKNLERSLVVPEGHSVPAPPKPLVTSRDVTPEKASTSLLTNERFGTADHATAMDIISRDAAPKKAMPDPVFVGFPVFVPGIEERPPQCEMTPRAMIDGGGYTCKRCNYDIAVGALREPIECRRFCEHAKEWGDCPDCRHRTSVTS